MVERQLLDIVTHLEDYSDPAAWEKSRRWLATELEGGGSLLAVEDVVVSP